jgi:effector-binding domain-containing protein
MLVYEVVLKAVKPITGVSLRLATADLTRQGHWIDVLGAMLKDYGVEPIDHLIVLHAESEDEYTPISVEIVAPVEQRDVSVLISRSEGRLTRCELPAFPRMAGTIHHGAPALVMPAYQAVGTWMENNAYTIVGQRRKICLRRGDNLDDSLTEIQFPVEKGV